MWIYIDELLEKYNQYKIVDFIESGLLPHNGASKKVFPCPAYFHQWHILDRRVHRIWESLALLSLFDEASIMVGKSLEFDLLGRQLSSKQLSILLKEKSSIWVSQSNQIVTALKHFKYDIQREMAEREDGKLCLSFRDVDTLRDKFEKLIAERDEINCEKDLIEKQDKDLSKWDFFCRPTTSEKVQIFFSPLIKSNVGFLREKVLKMDKDVAPNDSINILNSAMGMAEDNSPDYDYRKKFTSWTLQEAICLLHKIEPNNIGQVTFEDKETLGSSVVKTVNLAQRSIGDGTLKCKHRERKIKCLVGPVEFLRWASNCKLDIPLELKELQYQDLIKWKQEQLRPYLVEALLKNTSEENDNSNNSNSLIPIKTEGVTWSDITITFVGKDELLIQHGQNRSTRRFHEAGFNDKRNGKPISSWAVMKEASHSGEIPFHIGNRKVVEKTAQTIRRKIRQLFPSITEGDPIPLAKDKSSYKFAFKSGCSM